jgi:hypothetical protein
VQQQQQQQLLLLGCMLLPSEAGMALTGLCLGVDAWNWQDLQR